MSDENESLEDLFRQLAEDDGILEALAEHEDACSLEEGCIVCQTRIAIEALTYVFSITSDDHECEHEGCQDSPLTEYDIAKVLVEDLDTALGLIAVCQQSISVLTSLSLAAVLIVAQNEFEDEEDEEDEDYDE